MSQDETVSTFVTTVPKVYLVGRQILDDGNLGDFLNSHRIHSWSTDTDVAGEKLVEVAGRLCYMSFAKPRPGGNKAYVDHILDVNHGSVLEHSVYNFIFTGVSRSFTHELVRHRVGMSYSQLSQRFVDESSCEFVAPIPIASDPELYEVWRQAVHAAQEAYQKLADGLMKRFAHVEDATLRRKKAREAARSVLPNATETKIFVTANARALRHFIDLRASLAADAEIRSVAVQVLKILQVESPNLFGDYEIVPTHDSGEFATKKERA